jgi:hypothetical protein
VLVFSLNSEFETADSADFGICEICGYLLSSVFGFSAHLRAEALRRCFVLD